MSSPDYNLLQLAALHRAELDLLAEPSALFALTFLESAGRISGAELQSELGFDAATHARVVAQLAQANFISTTGAAITVTTAGHIFLREIGLGGILPPPGLPERQPQPTPGPKPAAKPPTSPETHAKLPPAKGTNWLRWIVTFGIVAVLIAALVVIFRPRPPGPAAEPPPTEIANITPEIPTLEPTIPSVVPELEIRADDSEIPRGTCTLLRWSARGGERPVLAGESVDLEGVRQVCPKVTTTYRLTMDSPEGALTRQVTVAVTEEPTPRISIQFWADTQALQAGACASLHWRVQGGFAVELDGARVEHEGDRQVCPESTRTFELGVDGGDHFERETLEIVVIQRTPTPTSTRTPTRTATPQAQYDLYVRRMDFKPSAPQVGDEISLTVMLASDTAPVNAAYFPESFFRWRQGENYAWHEEYCPPNAQYANCILTVAFAYAEPGTYNVQVEANSRGSVAESSLANNFSSYALNIGAPSPGALRGVVQSVDGSYLNNATVAIKGGPSASTFYGKYVLENLAPGTYTVTASQLGYYAKEQLATIDRGQTTNLDFVLTRAPQDVGKSVKLGYGDCFDFDTGETFFRPPSSEFWNCPTSADFQPQAKALQAVNNARLGYAQPHSSAYENCKEFDDTQLLSPKEGSFVCLRTLNQRVVVLQITDVTQAAVVFDWWGY